MWEIAIKVSLNKLALPQPFGTFIREQIPLNDLLLLPLRVNDCERLIALPFHHRDPFDRMLVAQALTEGISLVSVDAAFDAYPVQRLC